MNVRHVALVQSVAYMLTGVWPLLHLKSFEKVTGPKVDKWLVRAVGLLVSVIGAALLVASRRGATSPEAKTLGMGSAAALAAIDVYYVGKGRISRIYLLDAVFEVVLALLWLAARSRTAPAREQVPGSPE